MRLCLLLIFLVYGIGCFAQKSVQAQVTYQMYRDGDWPVKFPGILHIDGSTTIYQGQLTLKKDWDNGKEVSMPYPGTGKPMDDYIKINHATKEIYFFDQLPGSGSVFIKDIYPAMSWNITKEQKVIGSYDCIKATTTYRGRGWTAWFTPSITAPYGPWKLHGLPGLILEAYDEEKILTINFTKIEMRKSALISKPFTSLRRCRNTKAVPYEKFLQDRDEAMENILQKMKTTYPAAEMTLGKALRNGLEIKYEWEE